MAQTRSNTTRLNFVGGEISPRMAGRTDLDIYDRALSWCQNFIPLPQGPMSYRPGNSYCGLTINNANAVLIPFQFSANDAVMIVATNQMFRFYRNDQVILNAPIAITNILNSVPANVTAPAHGFTSGQEVQITGVVGMTELNNNFYIVTVVDANTLQLSDQFGNPIDSSAFTPYVSGGQVSSIYQITTPYLSADLTSIRYTQVGDVMYIVCTNLATQVSYPPYKLIRSGFTSWSLATFTRTNDPFTGNSSGAITGITNANPGVITASTAAVAALTAGQVITFNGVGGMTQLNGNFYQVVLINTTTFSLTDLFGNAIDTTTYGTWTSGGTFNGVSNYPVAVAFTADGRLAYGGSLKFPQGYWSSRLPGGGTGANAGAKTRYDDFTTGSDSTFAAIFQFAPVNNEIDNIQEMQQFGGNFALLGPSALLQVYGSQPGLPANPNAISSLPTIQGTARVKPLVINWDLVFVDVNQTSVRGLQYNLAFTSYEAKDYNLQSDHLGLESPFIKMVYTQWTQVDIIWCLRADGVLLALTFNNIENIACWSRHYIGGNGTVIDVGAIRKPTGVDELWTVVQRTINGDVTTTVEVMSVWPVVPLRRKFYSGAGATSNVPLNSTIGVGDNQNWQNAAWESLKNSTYLDMSFEYDGRARGVAADANLTISQTSGTISVTSDQPVFQASDKGLQLWKNYAGDGSGGGQAVITSVINSTQILISTDIAGVSTSNFDNTNPIPPGSWTIATNQVSNLGIFNGNVMSVQADGGPHAPTMVNNSILQLQFFAGVVQVGFNYLGFIASENLDPGGNRQGPSNSKPRNERRARVRLDNSCGGSVGTSEYMQTDIIFRRPEQYPNRPPPPFTGMKDTLLMDRWDNSVKQAVFMHKDPTPCTLVALDLPFNTVEPP